jgi:transposase
MSILNDEKILEGCTDTREIVARMCLAFRESGRFPKPISSKKIAKLLGVDPKTVCIHCKHFQKHGLSDIPTGHPAILNDAQLDHVVPVALEEFYSMRPVSCARLLWFIRSQYAIDISPDTLRHVLERGQRIKPCSGTPMETQRVHVTADETIEHLWKLQNTINNEPAGFVWNMDEIGHSDWADAHPETVYVPVYESTFECRARNPGKTGSSFICRSFELVPGGRDGQSISTLLGFCGAECPATLWRSDKQVQAAWTAEEERVICETVRTYRNVLAAP